MRQITINDGLQKIIDYRGKTPPKSDSGITLISAANIKLGTLDFSRREFISREDYLDWTTRGFTEPGDVLFTTEAPTAEVALYPDKGTYQISRRVIALRTDEKLLHNFYLFYLLQSPPIKRKMLSANRGSTVPRLLKTDITEFPIEVPNYLEQKEVAKTLSCLDRKIENLRRQNETLEAIAQTLFKHWFIDFEFPNAAGEPYKSSGGAMERSELGEIPAGWRVIKMEDIIEVRDGTHDSPKQTEEGFHLITSKHLKKEGIDFDTAYLIAESDYIEVNKRSKVDTYDILLSMIGTVGILYFVMDEVINFAIKNIGLFKASQNPTYAEYLYLLLDSVYGRTYFRTRLAGTTQSYLTLGSLRGMPIIEPSKTVLLNFKQSIEPLFRKTHINNQQIQTLTQTRDVLLPKLMSGKLRIKP